MIKTKVAFLEGRIFSNQSEFFKYFLNCSDWLDKSRPPQKPLLFWSCKLAIFDILRRQKTKFVCDQDSDKNKIVVIKKYIRLGPQSFTLKGVLNPNFRPFNFELNKK